jgi:uncharacterized membrane protein YsdA (DUF1294 family)
MGYMSSRHEKGAMGAVYGRRCRRHKNNEKRIEVYFCTYLAGSADLATSPGKRKDC